MSAKSNSRTENTELWDGYQADGTPAGVELVRGEPIPPGIFHLVCDILVRHTDGSYLLMQRVPRKPNFGGYWEATAGGSALMGEDPLTCARRELAEETGIRTGSARLIGRSVSHNAIYFLYLWTTDQDKSSVTLQPGETVCCKWLGEPEFISFINSGQMIPTQKRRFSDHFRQMGYLNSSGTL